MSDVVAAKLADGSQVEMEAVNFTARVDKTEDRKNDGNTYKGLLDYKEYTRRAQHMEDTKDKEAFMRKKAAEIVDKDMAARKKEEDERKARMARKKDAIQAQMADKEASKGGSEEPAKKKSKKSKKGGKAPVLSFDEEEEEG
mmetsp:Transcript_26266/g.31863  ORF Transcript_26266/g.31863 Transcript_26266/m.31863 type:complete len:142 (+) Transcript_26266:176-601(+)|eukprot:CAMPEP_0197858014 /NCGR_PEP_ID=MMETSP1438-20131217/31508_1 /TAXON_ID=1461541 /ORGANISM="Pterosperma sp., Strain CCMP1384" /LENGTH=141 /DNA_ID=CAMNT_0043474035 /DNA_START=176 /DNA_END=601 /DNA_ORIENTATION=-